MENGTKLTLSIIIPAYNCEKYVGRCIQSLVDAMTDEDFTKIEILLVNDGSTDKTFDILMDYEERYAFIRVVDQRNQGVSAARNIGLFMSDGKYVTFIDADDYVESNLYSSVIRATKEFEFDVLCYGMTEISGTKNDEIKFMHHNKFEDFVKYPKYMNSVCNKLFKRSIIEETGIKFNESMVTCEDLLFVFEVFTKAKDIRYIDINAYRYERRPDSVTKVANRIRESRDELTAANVLVELERKSGVDNKFSVSTYWRMVSAMRNLKDIEIYDEDEYRRKNPDRHIWKYTFKPSYFVISFFANLKFDIIPKIYIKLKNHKYRQ